MTFLILVGGTVEAENFCLIYRLLDMGCSGVCGIMTVPAAHTFEHVRRLLSRCHLSLIRSVAFATETVCAWHEVFPPMGERSLSLVNTAGVLSDPVVVICEA